MRKRAKNEKQRRKDETRNRMRPRLRLRPGKAPPGVPPRAMRVELKAKRSAKAKAEAGIEPPLKAPRVETGTELKSEAVVAFHHIELAQERPDSEVLRITGDTACGVSERGCGGPEGTGLH